MKLKTKHLMIIIACVLFVNSCGGAYYSRGVRPSVGVGFYHSTYGHGWGGGYYRGYNTGVADTVETVDTIETMDAIDSMGMPDMDMGPAIDFDF